MRLNLVAVAYAVWLVATEVLLYVFPTTGDDSTTLKVASLLGIIPVTLQLLLLGFNSYGLLAPVRMAFCGLLIVLLSFLGNAYWVSLVFLASLIYIFGVATVVAGSPDARLIRKIAAYYSIPAALYLLYVSVTGEHVWGRLEAHGITPDWWGLMAASLAIAGLAHRSWWLAGLCIGVGLYVANDASARSDILAVLAGLLAVGLLHLRAMRGPRLLTTIAASAVALVLLLLFLPPIIDAVTNIVASTMKTDDPNRGLGTGFTGRDVAWGEAIRVWLKSPLFGVGFHQHQMFTPFGAPAHSIYLAMLADTGIFGFIWYIFFTGASLYAALQISETRTRDVVVGTLVTYAAIGFFDTHGLSSGNPFSLYWEMCTFFALRYASIRRLITQFSNASEMTIAWRQSLSG